MCCFDHLYTTDNIYVLLLIIIISSFRRKFKKFLPPDGNRTFFFILIYILFCLFVSENYDRVINKRFPRMKI